MDLNNTNLFYNLGLKFLLADTLEETYKTIIKEVSAILPAKSGSILIKDHQQFIRVYSSAASNMQVTPRKRGFISKTLSSNQLTFVSAEEAKKAHPELKDIDVPTALMIPIRYKNVSLGTLAFSLCRDKNFTSKELDILKKIGVFACLVIQRKLLYTKAQKDIQGRDMFISLTAHEIRTPLTTIYGYSNLINRRIIDKKPINTKWAQDLNKEIKRLNRLINELLNLKNIKSGQLNYQFKSISIKSLIKKTLIDFKFNHPERKIQIVDKLKSSSDNLNADEDKLLQALVNILNNAVKFSKAKTFIKIYLTDEDKIFHIKIRDQGKGIKEKDIPNIFNPRYQANKNSSKGLGMGLYLTKSIITQHSGTIEVLSALKKGTTIDIKLPKK